MAALVYTLCLLLSPPTPPVYQGFAMPNWGTRGIPFARANSIDSIEGSDAYSIIGVSDADRKVILENPGKLLQVVARESSCHGHKILRVSYWKFKPTKEPAK